MRKTIVRVAVAAAMLSAVGSLALGQTAPDPHQHDQSAAAAGAGGASDPMMQMMSGMMGMMQMMHGKGGMGPGSGMGMPQMGMADRVEGRIAFLHAELKITSAQEKAWSRVADALRVNADRLKKAGAGAMPMQMASGGVLAALDADKGRLQARLAAVEELEAALKPLYEQLSEEQKKASDELLPSLTGMMGAGMMAAMGGGAMMGQGMAGEGASP